MGSALGPNLGGRLMITVRGYCTLNLGYSMRNYFSKSIECCRFLYNSCICDYCPILFACVCDFGQIIHEVH